MHSPGGEAAIVSSPPAQAAGPCRPSSSSTGQSGELGRAHSRRQGATWARRRSPRARAAVHGGRRRARLAARCVA